VKNFRANSVFQGKRKLLKNPECKTYIPYSENFQGNSVFQGKRKLLETLKWLKMYSIPWKISGETLISGQAQVEKNPEC